MRTVALAIWCGIFFIILSAEGFSFNLGKSRVSIDYGPRSIGLAKSYMGGVQPHGTIRNTGNLLEVSAQILKLVKQQRASEIVIGVPVDSNGILNYAVQNFNGRLCLNFSKVLCSIALHEFRNQVETFIFDERFTTKEANLRLQHTKVVASLDSMSAACLLERYIEDEGAGSVRAMPCSYPPPPELANFDYDTVKKHIRSVYDFVPISDKKRTK